jgi:colanic acid biosynthesis glycosyl transferase WcaI
MESERLKKRAKDEKMDNVRILDLQPRDVYFNIINSSDLSIVSLDSRMTAPCLPGKFVNLLGCRTAILANVPKVNDVYRIVTEENCGIAFEPGNIDDFEKAIRKLKDDPELIQKMGENGRRFLEKNMNLDKNSARYEQIFKQMKKGV